MSNSALTGLILMLIWLVVAFIMLIVAIRYYRKLFTYTEITEGTIVGAQVTHDEDRSIRGFFTYKTKDGQTFYQKTPYVQFGIYNKGMKYKVYYNPKNPSQAYIRDTGFFISLIVATILFLVTFFASICCGILGFMI